MVNNKTGSGLLEQTQPQTVTTHQGAQSELNLPVIVSTKEAARVAGVSVDFIRDRIADGTLPAYQAGQVIRIRLDDLNAMFTPVKP